MLDSIIAIDAPSVFAAHPKHDVSDRYGFISTADILANMRDAGFEVTHASQRKARADNVAYTKHLLKMRHRSMLDATGEVPEILITNSHNRSGSFRMDLGIFRFVCANGLVIGDQFESVRLRHTPSRALEVAEQATRIISDAKAITAQIDRLKSVPLDVGQRRALAETAVKLRWGETAPITPRELLQLRRFEDRQNDAWTVLNVIQENVIRGGMAGRALTGRRLTVRPVTSIDANLSLNKRLWDAATALITA